MTDKDTEYRELCKRLMETSVEDLHGYAAVEVGQLMGEASEALESMQAEIVRLGHLVEKAEANAKAVHSAVNDALRAENAELREHANALAVDIETHDHECQRLCGEGDQEALGCGYRPYFEFSGRRCPHCPIHNKLDGMALAAYRAWLERKP